MWPNKRIATAIVLLSLMLMAAIFLARHLATGPELNAVRTWGYQLQNVDMAELAGLDLDLLVIDHADSSGRPLLGSSVADLKRKSDGGRRIVLSYLSIGEAERYRSYWEESWDRIAPDWLGDENPAWPGNYAVDFADPDWQRLIYGNAGALLDTIIDQGFDGAYLDRVDAYYGQGQQARLAMKAFVAALKTYAENRRPGFLIFQQNAEELLSDPDHRAKIDGLAKEDLLFNVRGPGVANPSSMVQESQRLITFLAEEGKPVLVVEYDLSADQAAAATSTLRKQGYVPTMASRDLSQLPR